MKTADHQHQQPDMRQNKQSSLHPSSPLMSAIERQAMSNRPLCRCRVIYLGSSVPHITKNGLHGIQEPLRKLYPDEQFSPQKSRGAKQPQPQQAQPNQPKPQSNQQQQETIDLSHLSARLGIDSWLSVWSNGMLLENVDEFGREVNRFLSIESLHYCAAVRYFDTASLDTKQQATQQADSGSNLTGESLAQETGDQNNNNQTNTSQSNSSSDNERRLSGLSQRSSQSTNKRKNVVRFLPLDAPLFQCPGMLDPNHPPVFAAIMRRTTGIKVLECHAFICRRDAAANALVRCCTHAFQDLLNAKRLSLELCQSIQGSEYVGTMARRHQQRRTKSSLGAEVVVEASINGYESSSMRSRYRRQSKPRNASSDDNDSSEDNYAIISKSGPAARQLQPPQNSLSASQSSLQTKQQSTNRPENRQLAALKRDKYNSNSNNQPRKYDTTKGSSKSLYNDFMPRVQMTRANQSLLAENSKCLSQSMDLQQLASNPSGAGDDAAIDTLARNLNDGLSDNTIKRHSKSMQNLENAHFADQTCCTGAPGNLSGRKSKQTNGSGGGSKSKSKTEPSERKMMELAAPLDQSELSTIRRQQRRQRYHRAAVAALATNGKGSLVMDSNQRRCNSYQDMRSLLDVSSQITGSQGATFEQQQHQQLQDAESSRAIRLPQLHPADLHKTRQDINWMPLGDQLGHSTATRQQRRRHGATSDKQAKSHLVSASMGRQSTLGKQMLRAIQQQQHQQPDQLRYQPLHPGMLDATNGGYLSARYPPLVYHPTAKAAPQPYFYMPANHHAQIYAANPMYQPPPMMTGYPQLDPLYDNRFAHTAAYLHQQPLYSMPMMSHNAQQPLASGTMKKGRNKSSSKSTLARFRCLSPPINFFASNNQKAAAAAAAASKYQMARHDVEPPTSGNPSDAAVPQKIARSAQQDAHGNCNHSTDLAAEATPAESSAQHNISGNSIGTSSANGSGGQVVSGKPSFMAAASVRDKKISWIKRLSLTMSPSSGGQVAAVVQSNSNPTGASSNSNSDLGTGREQKPTENRRNTRRRSSLLASALTLGRIGGVRNNSEHHHQN